MDRAHMSSRCSAPHRYSVSQPSSSKWASKWGSSLCRHRSSRSVITFFSALIASSRRSIFECSAVSLNSWWANSRCSFVHHLAVRNLELTCPRSPLRLRHGGSLSL